MNKQITLSVNSNIVNSKDEAKKLLSFSTMTFDIDSEGDKKNLIQVLMFNNHSVNLWNGTRNSRNNVGVYGVALDFDSGNLTFHNAIKRFQKYNNIIYTTSSHTPEKPRLRVILPFGTLLFTNGTKDFYATCKILFPDADSSCFDSARIFFPCCPPGRDNFECDINANGEWYRLPSVSPTGLVVKSSHLRVELPSDIEVRFPDGESITFTDVTEHKTCFCPAPDNHADGTDNNASAFCAVKAENNQPFIYCSACTKTFFCEGDYGDSSVAGIRPSVLPDAFLKAFSLSDIEFQLNDLTDTVYVKAPSLTGNQGFVPMKDRVASTIIAILCGYGFRQTLVNPNIDAAANADKFNPVKDYFTGLDYDRLDHIWELAKYLEDDSDLLPMLLPRFLIGVVARVFEPTQNPMLILEGDQGIGKSEFVDWLGTPFGQHRRSGTIEPENKDHRLARADNVLWEVSELGNTWKKADREHLKAFISEKQIKDRRPYGKRDILLPAIVSFIGTYNDEGGFLNDPTGNRRFNPVTLNHINWSYRQDIDIDQIWAEAYHLYKEGEPWQLLPEEEQIMRDSRSDYEVESALEDEIMRIYDFDPNDKKSHVLSRDLRVDIASSDYKYGSEEALSRQIAQTCRKIGAARVRRLDPSGRKVSAYLGLKSKRKSFMLKKATVTTPSSEQKDEGTIKLQQTATESPIHKVEESDKVVVK